MEKKLKAPRSSDNVGTLDATDLTNEDYDSKTTTNHKDSDLNKYSFEWLKALKQTTNAFLIHESLS